jgi:hypothetical protein
VESEFCDNLGPVVLLDPIANNNRKRQRPDTIETQPCKSTQSAVEIAYQEYSQLCGIPLTTSHGDK